MSSIFRDIGNRYAEFFRMAQDMRNRPLGAPTGVPAPSAMENAQIMRTGTMDERMAALQRLRGMTGGGAGKGGPATGIQTLPQRPDGSGWNRGGIMDMVGQGNTGTSRFAPVSRPVPVSRPMTPTTPSVSPNVTPEIRRTPRLY